MFVSISPEKSVKKKDIIGIFDLDSATVSPITRAYLRNAEKNKRLISVSDDLPKSFAVTDDGVYLIKYSVSSLKTRL